MASTTASKKSAPTKSKELQADATVDPSLDKASQPYVGRWQNLISTTNWEKGRIILQWREALIESGAPATEYSDGAWAQRVGGVTSPHVGRLRRVFEVFGEQQESYPGLFWSHFLAALDWDDAEMWLEGAMRSAWSVSAMREQRWQSLGAIEADRPSDDQISSADTDEDVVLPAQGGSNRASQADEAGRITTGPSDEDPDFGDEDQLGSASASGPKGSAKSVGDESGELLQPFAGLPDLPGDMSEALEMFKLAILRHKANSWADVSRDTVLQIINGLKQLTTNPA